MSPRKRALSSGETRLSARPSPYHSAVTLVEAAIVAESSSSSVRRSKRVKVENNPHPAPVNWRETYDTIKEMRSRIKAPVDTMGCDQAQLKEQEPKNQRFATLVSLMLSSQTKDEVTDAAVAKLREAVGGTLSVDAVLQADDSVIFEAICKVGFWRRKTGYIKKAAERLRDDFDSDVPKTVDELCSLPGVGPKMAFLALQVAWNLNHGIGVDVHVHRITNRLGWHRPPTKTPEQTRLNLQSWLPKELHGEINHLLVGFGQTVCLPVNPLCDLCELPSKMLCPSARKVVKSKTKKAVLVQAESGPKVEIGIEEENTILEQRDDSSELSSS
ncbi:DNA glycosylase [Gloeophyllum trabeum ATCC 11539]|uniref:Endonuclease III homolog n=1 Tax=Gloeophyllum trabeum (strain ATCC 11539 / FP-39264 / Madison 617) TaxID=670483 RepID=S7PTF3_GLOTA|nr:DNA glycosylase [Gloeophyllum trabeum ATCC 11539]EPQ50587.1 DNA glycosylase [Gloeophyllum trabeum ATCC 11539]